MNIKTEMDEKENDSDGPNVSIEAYGLLKANPMTFKPFRKILFLNFYYYFFFFSEKLQLVQKLVMP